MNFKPLHCYFFGILVVFSSACTKFEVPEKKIGITQNFKELKVEESFEWKTTKNVQLNVKGLETMNPVRSIFRVKNANGELMKEEARLMSESFSLNLEIPITEKSIKVEFGSLEKEVEIKSAEIEFEYALARPAEIIEE